jgi:hypothetical protein
MGVLCHFSTSILFHAMSEKKIVSQQGEVLYGGALALRAHFFISSIYQKKASTALEERRR